MIRKDIRLKVVDQIRKEITIARNYKNLRTTSWHLNEDAYEGKKKEMAPGRANVNLGQMQGFIQTLLAKIDNPLIFRSIPAEIADKTKSKQYNALAEQFAESDYWDKKGRAGNFQALMYGRGVFQYFMKSTGKDIVSVLTPIDVHKFLIDPQAGGLDMDDAMYMGHFGVKLSTKDIKAGVKEKLYYKDTARQVLEGEGDHHQNKEELDSKQRYADMMKTNDVQKGVYYFWAWCTTFEGERYYALYHENTGEILRLEKLEDVQGHDMWPYWSWATFPDMTHFWTPSYADIARELIDVQNININQMLDNAQRVNYPERYVRSGSVKNPQRLQRYTPNGIITVNPNFQASDIQSVSTPSINTPITVYDKIDQILALNTGVSADMKGVSEEDKVGIYEGNVAMTADRLGNLDKSRSDGWKRFANLFYKALKANMTTKVAIKMVGTEGATYQKVNVKEVIPTHDFDFTIESTRAEEEMNARDSREKMAYLDSLVGNPEVNQLELAKMRASVAGVEPEQMRRLFDKSGMASESIEAAEQDLQALLSGKEPKRRVEYTQDYMKYMNKYLMEEGIELKEKQYQAVANHMQAIMPKFEQTLAAQLADEAGLPLQDVAQTPLQNGQAQLPTGQQGQIPQGINL